MRLRGWMPRLIAIHAVKFWRNSEEVHAILLKS
jgi:hypothetical protein